MNFKKTFGTFFLLFFYLTQVSPSKSLSCEEYLEAGKAFQKEKKTDMAINCYKKTLEMNPNHLTAHFNLGVLFFNQMKKELALEQFKKATEIEPKCAPAWQNLGRMYQSLGYLDSAVVAFRNSLALDPGTGKYHGYISEIYLTKGDFDKGYDELRWENKKQDSLFLDPSTIEGKTILFNTGGIGCGDFFQYVRWVTFFKKNNAKKIILKIAGSLIPLATQCKLFDEIISENSPCDNFDMSLHIADLLTLFRPTFDSMIPYGIPYMHADKNLVKKWGSLLEKDKNFKIGLCWHGNFFTVDNVIHNERSLTVDHFLPLQSIRGISLYSLQKIYGLDQLNNLPDSFKIHAFSSDLDTINGSFMDTAAIMKNLDLVITIDTSIAHLAGALGVPVWVLLQKNANWRWFLDRDDSPWYPTMRLFRQTKQDDWKSVIQDVVKALAAIVEK